MPLLLAVQDGFISAIARGPVTLGAVYDPASLPLEFVSPNSGLRETYQGQFYLVLPDTFGTVSGNGSNLLFGQIFTTYGPASGVALASTAGDVTALGQGDTGITLGANSPYPVLPQLLPATLDLTAFSGNVVVNDASNDANLVPYPTQTGNDTGSINIVVAQSISISAP